MPYKSGKLKGQLTNAEIKKLIRGHNKLVDIKIPSGATRETLLKLVTSNGYKLDHEKQALIPKVAMKRKPKVTLEKAKELTKPKPLTEAEKKKKEANKKKKETERRKREGKLIKAGAVLGRARAKRKKSSPKVIKKVKKIYINKGDDKKPKEAMSQAEVQSKWADIQANYNIDAGDKNRVDNIVTQNDRITKFKVADGKYLKIKYGDKTQVQIEVEKK